MSEHPDYEEINRLERELFPEWFDDAGKPVAVPQSPEDDSRSPDGRARKNPNWSPNRATLLRAAGEQPDPVAPQYWAGSARAISAVSIADFNDTYLGPRLRRVGE